MWANSSKGRRFTKAEMVTQVFKTSQRLQIIPQVGRGDMLWWRESPQKPQNLLEIVDVNHARLLYDTNIRPSWNNIKLPIWVATSS